MHLDCLHADKFCFLWLSAVLGLEHTLKTKMESSCLSGKPLWGCWLTSHDTHCKTNCKEYMQIAQSLQFQEQLPHEFLTPEVEWMWKKTTGKPQVAHVELL